MNWRYKKATYPQRLITWKMVEQNKWGSKISETNYIFVIITLLADGKYELTYMDADLKQYNINEKEVVSNKFNIGPYANRQLALKLMEYYGHYEWKETLENKEELMETLVNQTSFELSLLKNLKE